MNEEGGTPDHLKVRHLIGLGERWQSSILWEMILWRYIAKASFVRRKSIKYWRNQEAIAHFVIVMKWRVYYCAKAEYGESRNLEEESAQKEVEWRLAFEIIKSGNDIHVSAAISKGSESSAIDKMCNLEV